MQEPEFRALYKVGRALGRGAMGVVFSGEQVATGRPVAIKFMLRMDDEIALARLEREGRSLAKVAHPGLTRVLDCGSVQGHPYLVTELLTGGTLLEKLDRAGRFRVEDALVVAQDLLPALQACHDAGVIHRDIKPDNILLDEAGRAKLADLGVARWENAPRVLTATGAVVGTPLYIAPELLRGEEASVASDLYAFGVTLHYLLATEPPFRSQSLPELLKMHMYEAPPRLDERCGLPTPVAAAILRLLEKQAIDRPATATLALGLLEDAVAGRAPRARTGRVRAPRSIAVSPRVEPAEGYRVVAAALGLGLATMLAVVLWPGRAPVEPPPRALPTPVASAAPAARYAPLGDGGGALPKGAVGRLGSIWGQQPHLKFADVSPDGHWFATGTTNGVRAWDARLHRYRGGFRPKLNQIAGLRQREDGLVAIGYMDDSIYRFEKLTAKVAEGTLPLDVYLWNPDTGAARVVRCTGQAGAWTLAAGGRYATWWDGVSGEMRVQALDGDAPAETRGASAPPVKLDLTPDGKTLAMLSPAGAEVRVNGWPALKLARSAGAMHVALSADGTRAAVSGPDGIVTYALPGGVVQKTIPGSAGGVEFSPDGKRLAARVDDGFHVYDAASLAVLEVFPDASKRSLAATGLFRFNETSFHYPGAPAAVPPIRVVWVHPEARGALYEEASGALGHWNRVTGAHTRILPTLAPWVVVGQPRDGQSVHLRRATESATDKIRIVGMDGTTVRELDIEHASAYLPLSGAGRGVAIHTDHGVDVHEPDRVRRLKCLRLAVPPPDLRVSPFGPIDHAERRLILHSPDKGLVVLDLFADDVHTIWTAAGVARFNRPRTAWALENRGAILSAVDGAIAYLEPRRYTQTATFTKDHSALDASIGATDGSSVLLGYASSAIHLWFPEKKESRMIRDRVGLEVRQLGYDEKAEVALSLEDGGLLTMWDLKPGN